MILAEFGTGQALWTIAWFFLFIVWFWLLMVIFGDLFRDQDLSGWAKAAWSVFVIFLPYLGIFTYLITRGRGMADRSAADQRRVQAEFDAYIREAAGSGGPAQEIARGKQLLDSGVISPSEFDAIKRTAVASSQTAAPADLRPSGV